MSSSCFVWPVVSNTDMPRIMFMCEGKMELQISSQQSRSRSGRSWVWRQVLTQWLIHVPTLIYGHELCVVAEMTRSLTQAKPSLETGEELWHPRPPSRTTALLHWKVPILMIQTSNYGGPWMPPCGVSLGISKNAKTQGHTQNILKGVEMTLGRQIPVTWI